MTGNTSDIAARKSAVKKEFFAMRNGIVADTLRKGGIPHTTVFGLQIPQLGEIARRFGKDAAFARELWLDHDVRESRLLACWLMPADAMEIDEASGWAADTRTREEADILAFRLLRHLPYAEKLLHQLEESGTPETKYPAEALRRNLEAMKA